MKLQDLLEDDFMSDKYSDSGVYSIYHQSMPGWYYIGLTKATTKKTYYKGFRGRWFAHFRALIKKTHTNKLLQKVVNDFGILGLRFEILHVSNNPINEIALEYFYLEQFSKTYKLYNSVLEEEGRIGFRQAKRWIILLLLEVDKHITEDKKSLELIASTKKLKDYCKIIL